MKYVILHYFFMVHLCNIKMSAMTIRHKSNGETYDIDGFINQLLASRKFDELAEKVADKAAIRIMSIEAAPARLERFSDSNKVNKTTENMQQNYRDKEYDKENSVNTIKLRNDNGQGKQGKIDTQAVMMDENTSQSDSLRLKYKYLTRNAYEKKVFSDRGSEKADHPFPRNDQNEDPPKRNENAISAEKFKDHETKTDERTHQDTSEKNQHSSNKNEFTDENSRWRHDTRGDDRKDLDSNRNSKSHDNPHMDGDRNENNKSSDHQREDQDARHEQTHSREAQNSRPEFKSIIKNEIQEVGHVDNSTTEEENPSSLDEENVETNPPSEEKATEEVEKAEEEPEKSSAEENVENEELNPIQFRGQEETDPNIDENKITSDNQQDGAAYGYVYKSEEHKEVAEEAKTEEQKTEEQKTEEQKTEEQPTEEQPTEEQKTEEQQDSKSEEKPPVPYKPVIRREGDKLYTYVEAPEYQEYHEQMAKMLKEHPVNPTDFI